MTTKPSGDNVDTGEYSATKAPENRPHVESTADAGDLRQTPGGAGGAAIPIGLSALDPDLVPDMAGNPSDTPNRSDERADRPGRRDAGDKSK